MGITKQKDLIVNDFKGVQSIKISRCPIIVIYDKPSDYPNYFVARLFNFSKPTKMIILKDTLEELRETIPSSMVWFERFNKDDEKIVECYM